MCDGTMQRGREVQIFWSFVEIFVDLTNFYELGLSNF
jgi:hypothetical protein